MSSPRYISPEISRKLRALSFLGAVSVVIIHSNPLETIADPLWAGRLGNWVGYLQRWAVPYFFITSGFFFDRGYAAVDRDTMGFFHAKARSLLVPYLLWGAVYGTLTMTPVLMGVNRMKGVDICIGTIFQDFEIWPLVNRVFGIAMASPPNGALWYVRLCMIFFLFAPVWRWLRKRVLWSIPCMAFGCIMFGTPFLRGYSTESITVHGTMIACSLLGIGYLLLGMTASIFRAERLRVDFSCMVSMLIAWCAWTYVTIESSLGALDIAPSVVLWNHKVSGMLLIGALWGALDIAWPVLAKIRPEIIGLSFWIYCMHHPVTSCVGAALHAVLGRTLIGEVWRLILSAPITLSICIVCGLMVRKCGVVYSLLTGGRSK